MATNYAPPVTSLHEDIAHACTRPILNLNWKIIKSYSIHTQVIVIFKSIILKSVNQTFFFIGTSSYSYSSHWICDIVIFKSLVNLIPNSSDYPALRAVQSNEKSAWLPVGMDCFEAARQVAAFFIGYWKGEGIFASWKCSLENRQAFRSRPRYSLRCVSRQTFCSFGPIYLVSYSCTITLFN